MEHRKSSVESMEVNKVLIFGSSGFVGSNVTRFFLQKGEEVYVCLRDHSDKWRINDIVNNLNVQIGDLSSKNDIESVLFSVKPDIVINCTGVVAGFDVQDQQDVIQKNFVNTVNLTNVCINSKTEQLINTGSAYECGFSNDPVLTNKCLNSPIGLYGITKKAEREYIDMIAKKFEKKYITLRLFTPFGPFDSPIRLIPYILTSLINNQIPNIQNPLSGRDFIYIEDVSDIFYRLAKNPEIIENQSVLNVGTGKNTKVIDIVEILFKLAGADYKQHSDYQNSSIEFLYANKQEADKLLSKFNITLTPLFEALKQTYDWFSQNKNFYTSNVNKESR